MLLDLKLKFNMDDVFKDFSQYFNEKDYSDTLRSLTYKENNKYGKTKIMNFWHEIIGFHDSTYTNSLLNIFNKYCDVDDIGKYEDELIQIIKNGFPDSLVANRSISDFFDKLLLYIKVKKNVVVAYNILDEIITSMKTVKYIYKELDIIKDMLKEFKNLGKLENAQLIAKKIYETPSTKYYATNLKEYLI